MTRGWTRGPISDGLSTIIDYRGKTPPKSKAGITLISAANVKGGKLDFSRREFIAEEDYARWTVRGFTAPGDVLITTEAPAGEVAPYPKEGTFQISRRVMALRANETTLHHGYLLYALQSYPVQAALLGRNRGTTVPRVLKTDITGLEILLPPLPEQRRIAEILGALDDKIELNRKMNQTLEEMAQAIFESTLAGCDPIEGELPAGWLRKSLGQAAKESGGAVQTGPFGSQLHASDYVEHGIPSVMPKDLKEDRISTSSVARVRESDAARLSKHRLVPGDVIYSRRGDVERRALVLDRETGWLCGTGCLRVRLGAEFYNPHFLYQYLGLPTIRAWIVRHAQGATMPNLNTKILGSLPFCVPSHQEQERIGHAVGTLHLKREGNFAESETLTQLRDTLLPKLVSGELRVPDAENAVESVA